MPTLDALATFDQPHQRAIFNAIAPEARAALWREHFERFGRQANLSLQQQELIRAARELVTADFYRGEPAATIALRQLWSRAEPLFTTSGEKRAWFALAGTSGGTRAEGYCECNPSDPIDCSSGSNCVTGGCTFTSAGCGMAWGKPCTGLCN
jgi:hypothetical protein